MDHTLRDITRALNTKNKKQYTKRKTEEEKRDKKPKEK